MKKMEFCFPVDRPRQFSSLEMATNRECSFQTVLEKADSDLSVSELESVLWHDLPDETFGEVAYFLPIALRRIATYPKESSQLISRCLSFGETFGQILRQKRWWGIYCSLIWTCFEDLHRSVNSENISSNGCQSFLEQNAEAINAICEFIKESNIREHTHQIGEAMALHVCAGTHDPVLWIAISLYLTPFLDEFLGSLTKELCELITNEEPRYSELIQIIKVEKRKGSN